MKKKYDWDRDDHNHYEYNQKQKDYYSDISKKKYEERVDNYKSQHFAVKPKAIPKEQVLELFWNKLLNYGWRLHTKSDGMELLVLPCPLCEEIVSQVIIANFTSPNQIEYSTFAPREIMKHQSGKGCTKATPEGASDVTVQ